MRGALLIAVAMAITGCARSWQPFSDDTIGQAKTATWEQCMAREWLQTKAAEARCLDEAKRAQAQPTGRD